jgi:long-chain acyl-CoA synthetase
MGRRLKYRDVDEMSLSLGAWLQHRGLAPGARVAIMMPNVLQYLVSIAAILRAGYVVVNVNPLYTPRELEHQLKDSGAEAIVILETFAVTLEQVMRATNIRHVVLASLGDLLGFWKGLLVNFAVATCASWSLSFVCRWTATAALRASTSHWPMACA